MDRQCRSVDAATGLVARSQPPPVTRSRLRSVQTNGAPAETTPGSPTARNRWGRTVALADDLWVRFKQMAYPLHSSNPNMPHSRAASERRVAGGSHTPRPSQNRT